MITAVLTIVGLSLAMPLSADTLTLSACVRLALRNNPAVLGAEGAQEIARGTYELSRAALLPKASLQSSFSDNAGEFSRSPQSYGASAQVEQLVTDFGKTRAKTAAARTLQDATESDALTVRQNLILETHVAYFNLLAEKSIHNVNIEALKLAQAHLERARLLLEAGKGVRFSVVKAEVDLETARLNALRAENNVKVRRIQLSGVIGTILTDSLALVDSLDCPIDTVALDSALSQALSNRSELRTTKLRLAANEYQLSAARRGYLPSLTVSGGYGLHSDAPIGTAWEKGWSAGLSLSAPLFSGGSTSASVRQAGGAVMSAEAALKNSEQSIILDVQQQCLRLNEAAARIDIAAKVVEQAGLALRLAQERFAVGSGDALEISDSEYVLSNAKVALVLARADYRISHARLQRAMGTLNENQ